MKTHSSISNPSTNRNEHGIALVITIIFLAVITVLVIAFAAVMRTESVASTNYRFTLQARQIAQAGLAEGIARLRVTMLTNSVYVSSPGQVVTADGAYPLYSDVGSGTININSETNIIPDGSTIQVQWIDVKDSADKKIGQYAYWIDDESAKVNINTANQRDPNALTYTLSDIDLQGLGANATEASASYNYATANGFPTSASWPLAPGGVTSEICSQNLFNVTAYSQSTKLTPWGEPCLNLNVATVDEIVAYLTNSNLRTTSPSFPQTFQDKYGDNVYQIAANIVDYIGTGNIPSDSGGDPPTYLGLKRTPYLNELVVSNSFRVATNEVGMVIQMNSTTYVELWYMYPSPDFSLDGTVTLQNQPSITFDNGFPAKTFSNPNASSFTGTMVGKSWAGSFEPVLIKTENTYAYTNNNLSDVHVTFNPGTVTAVFVNTVDGTSVRIDYASIPMTNHTVTLNANMAGSVPNVFGSVTNLMWGTACQDPRCKPVNKYWNPLGGGTTFRVGTLGGWNNGTVGTYNFTNNAPGGSVPLVSDTVISGTSSDYSCHTNIANAGAMSLGELGFIHTGVPWRTICLGPTPTLEINSIPDWAMLDLFTCTNEPTAGRININARVNELLGTTVVNKHQNSLDALLYGTGVSSANLFNRTGYTPPTSYGNFTNGYAMVGQICEVPGMNLTGTKVQVEAAIRAVANVINTRSDTFTIWVRAQIMPYGDGRIFGEARLQTVVNRNSNNGKWQVVYQRWM